MSSMGGIASDVPHSTTLASLQKLEQSQSTHLQPLRSIESCLIELPARPEQTNRHPKQQYHSSMLNKSSIDTSTLSLIYHWPTSQRHISTESRHHGHISQHQHSRPTPPALKKTIKQVTSNHSDINSHPTIRKTRGKYEEVPHLLDGFRMLNYAPATDPELAYSLDISSQQLMYVVEDDLSLFTKLHTLRAGENTLPFARLGTLPALKTLILPCNKISSLDLEADGRFSNLTFLDLSFNTIDISAQIVLATFPNLKHLDLTNNSISTLAPTLLSMESWHDRVIELLLPHQVAQLDAKIGDFTNLHPESIGCFGLDSQKEDSNSHGAGNEPTPPKDSNLDIDKLPTGIDVSAFQAHLQKPVDSSQPIYSKGTHTHRITEPSKRQNSNSPSSTSVKALLQSLDVPTPNGNPLPAAKGDFSRENSESSENIHNTREDDVVDDDTPTSYSSTRPCNGTPPTHLGYHKKSDEQYNSEGKPLFHPIDSNYNPLKESSHGNKQDLPDVSVPTRKIIPSIGFQALEVLILENNRLGTTGSTDFWSILQALPRIRILNLSNNYIHTLRRLIPHESILAGASGEDAESTWTPSDLLQVSPQSLTKLDGFNMLEELYLIKNRISTLDDLVGLVFLRKLRRVFLQDNPVMRQYIPKHLQHRVGHNQDDVDEINLFSLFSGSYGITIADACFQPPKSSIDEEFIAVNPMKVAFRGELLSGMDTITMRASSIAPSKLNRSNHFNLVPIPKRMYFIRNYLGRAIKVQGGDPTVPHTVDELSLIPSKPILKNRQRRRHYKFTDEDLQEIVKFGRIPEVKDLMKLAKIRETQQQRRFQDPDTLDYSKKSSDESVLPLDHSVKNQLSHGDHNQPETQEAMPSNEALGEDATIPLHGIMYDPSHIDDTFMTGVHITGGNMDRNQDIINDNEADGDNITNDSKDTEILSSDESEHTIGIDTQSNCDSDCSDNQDDQYGAMNPVIEKKLDRVYSLPTSIQGSVKALRHALANPVSYWRILEESYSHSTYASLKHNTTLITREQRRDEMISTGFRTSYSHKPHLANANAGHIGEGSLCTSFSNLGIPKNNARPSKANESGQSALSHHMPPLEFTAQNHAQQGIVSYTQNTLVGIGDTDSISRLAERKSPNHHFESKLNQQHDEHATLDNQRNAGARENNKKGASCTKKLAFNSFVQRAQLGGRLRPRDEFEELNDVMSFIDSKISTIEASIDAILQRNTLKHPIPCSRRLLKKLQK
ncbi:hypothetical protein BASA60_010764 [Batrachochytrium salamandrivorans]|nr:hypothetical protein BASA60_010764 [Batrachochytrium salamandrivorans]